MNLVDKFYRMNPETDYLIPNGKLLENGMIVLLEDTMMRVDTERFSSKYEEHRAEEVNRWCEVSELEVRPRFEYNERGYAVGEGSPLISFIGIYSDGVQIKRSYDASFAWIVRKSHTLEIADDLSELDPPKKDEN